LSIILGGKRAGALRIFEYCFQAFFVLTCILQLVIK
jgi:hypothetical protein